MHANLHTYITANINVSVNVNVNKNVNAHVNVNNGVRGNHILGFTVCQGCKPVSEVEGKH